MALRVEVAGFGLCRTAQPYSIFVICVQQEKFEAWTVYRRLHSFALLRDQLISHHPNIPALPSLDPNNLTLDYLESARQFLDRWLQNLTSNTYILRMQSMYQFLCIDANMPPPYLEVHWRNSNGGHGEDLEMDEMFEEEENHGDEWDEDDEDRRSSMMDNEMETVFAMDGASENKHNGRNGKHSPKSSRSGHNKKRPNMDQSPDDDDAKDGMDIQSLSFVEAEFIYDKKDEDNKNGGSSSTSNQPTNPSIRTINLEAFKIIKVIGKGK